MATTTIFSGGTHQYELGSDSGGTAGNYTGNTRFAKILVNGDKVADLDARVVPAGTTTIRDPQGNIWQLIGTAVIAIDGAGTEYIDRVSMNRTSNVLNYDNDGTDQPITGIMVIGQGEGNSQAMTYVQNTRGKMPLYEDSMAIKDQIDEDVLAQMGRLQLSANATADGGYTLELDPNLHPFYDELEVGQIIRLVINHGFTQEDGYFVIGRLRNNPSKQGTDQISMELFPALDLRMSTSAIYSKLDPATVLYFSDMEIGTGESSTRYLPEWAAHSSDGINSDGSHSFGFWGPHVDTSTQPYRDADYHFLYDSVALSGKALLRTQISNAYTVGNHGALLWRYVDRNNVALPADAYYSFWVRFPQAIHIDSGGFINQIVMFQTAPGGGNLLTMQAGYFNGSDTTFRWYFHLDGIGSFDLAQVGGTHHVVPTDDWTHIEMRYKRATSGGIWQVWANGTQILNYSGATMPSGVTQHAMALGIYGTKLIPDNPVVDYDDFLISTIPVHSLIFI